MNYLIIKVLDKLLRMHCIGGKHIPEDLILNKIYRNLNKSQRKVFDQDYKQLLNLGYLIREKKRTGKGYDYHISINSSFITEVKEIIEEGDFKNEI